MKNCININHPDVTILASELNLPKIVVAAKIGVWQEEHNILDRFPTTEELFTNSIINKNIVKPGVKELFESNSELAQIGTPEQYSQYLDTIFPDSQVKDIVYHGTNKQFDTFIKRHDYTVTYFTKNKEYAKIYGTNIKNAILNIKNLLDVYRLAVEDKKEEDIDLFDEFQDFLQDNEGRGYSLKDLNNKDIILNHKVIALTNRPFLLDFYRKKGYDSLLGSDEYVVFEPEQIHILGSKQDIEGFKEFIQSKNIESSRIPLTSDLESLDVSPNLPFDKIERVSNMIINKLSILGNNFRKKDFNKAKRQIFYTTDDTLIFNIYKDILENIFDETIASNLDGSDLKGSLEKALNKEGLQEHFRSKLNNLLNYDYKILDNNLEKLKSDRRLLESFLSKGSINSLLEYDLESQDTIKSYLKPLFDTEKKTNFKSDKQKFTFYGRKALDKLRDKIKSQINKNNSIKIRINSLKTKYETILNFIEIVPNYSDLIINKINNQVDRVLSYKNKIVNDERTGIKRNILIQDLYAQAGFYSQEFKIHKKYDTLIDKKENLIKLFPELANSNQLITDTTSVIKTIINSNSKFKELALRLLPFVEKTNVKVIITDNYKGSSGSAGHSFASIHTAVDKNTKKPLGSVVTDFFIEIDINTHAASTQPDQLLLHEIVHSLSQIYIKLQNYELKEKNPYANILEYINKVLREADVNTNGFFSEILLPYGLKNEYELFSETLTNGDFQELLKSLPPINDNSFRSLFEQIIDFIARLFNIERYSNLYEQLEDVIYATFDAQSELSLYLDDLAKDLKKDISEIEIIKQSKYQKAEQSILTPQQIQNIQEVNKPIYIGGFSTEGRGTLEGDGKDKQMRKDSVGFIGELNPNKSDRFESSTYGSFLHFNSNPVIVQEDRLIYSLPDNINKGNKIMLALNGSVPDTDLLDKTKQLLLDLHNKGFEFIVGDMPSDHPNNRLGDDDFVRYLQSIGANYTVYGNGKESRIPLTFDKILTEQQRQNIQELKQIEPAYAVASDEKVQEFIESIYPESKIKDIVWHGTDTQLNLNNEPEKRNFDFSKGFHFDYIYDKAYSWGKNVIPIIVDVRNPYEIKKTDDIKDAQDRYMQSSYLSALAINDYDPTVDADEHFRDGIIKRHDTETGGEYLNIASKNQITILNSSETIQKWNEFLDKPKYQKDANQKLASKEQQEKTIALSQKIASLLNLDIQIVNDVNSKYKGKIDGNTVIINVAYADTSTPLHELLGHPVIAHIKQTDINFYNKLINELTSTDEGNAILERVKEDYSELSESEQIEEAIVEYLSIIANRDLSKSAFRKLLDKILEFINKAFDSNYSTIPSFQELSNDLQDYINQVERDFHRDIDAISELFFKSNLNTYHSKLPILETLNGAEGMKLLKKTFGETNAKKIVEFIPSAKVLAIPFVNLVNELFIDPTQIDDFMSRDQNLIKLNEIFEDKINPTGKKEPILLNPFEIVKEKGYTLTEVKTVKDMLVFKKDYDKGYTICTFNDNNGKNRLTTSHILWLRKDYASDILPYNMLTQEYLHSESKDAEAWRNYLKEKKMYDENTDTYTIPKNPSIYDPYAISSVSIQFSRDPNSNLGRKMVNRYNHAVDRFDGSADYAFKNNLDNVVPNLKNSLRHYLGLKLDLSGIDYDDNVQMVGDKIFVYRREIANTYVNKNSYLRYDQVHFINKDHQILMSNGLIFDFKAKTITNLDGNSTNELFTYNSKIIDIIKNQNKINIILENSEYVTIVIDNNNNIIKLESNVNQIPYGFLYITNTIEEIILSSVTNINDEFLKYNTSLKKLELPKVKTVGNQFLSANTILSSIYLPLVTRVGNNFLASNKELTSLNLPHLEYIGSGVLQINKKIQSLTLPKVSRIGNQFMAENSSLREFNAPLLKTVGDNVLLNNIKLRYLNLPLLEGTGINFLTNNRGLRFLYFPNLNSINNQSFNSIEKGAYLYFPNLYYIADSAFNILSNSFLRTIPKSTYIPNTTDPHAYYGNMKDIIAKTFVESHGEIISKLALKYGSYKFQKYFNDYLIKNLRGTLEEFEKASDLIINNENEIAITTESTVEEVAEKMKQRFGIDYELLDDAEFEQRLNDANVKYESKVVPPLATITDEELEESLQKSIENEIADYERLIVNGEEITPETMKKDENVYNLYQDIVRYDEFIAKHFTSIETNNLFNPSFTTLIKHFVVKYNVDISPLLTPKPFDIKEYIKIIHSLNKEISEITSTLKYKTNPNDNPELYKQYPFTIKTLFELKIAAVGTIWLQLNSKTDEYKLNDLKFVVDDTERLTHSFSLKLYNNRDSVGWIDSTTQIESTGVNHEYVKTSERLGQRLYRGFSWGLKSVSDEHVISYKNFVPITVNDDSDIHAYKAWERWVEKGIAIDKGQYYQILKQKDDVSTRGFYDPYLRKAILRKNGATLSTPIHEAFSHPFIELVKVENPDLYENLLNRARYISEIKSHVDSVYSDVSQDVRDKEYIAHAIDLYYKIELNNHEYYGLIDAIRQFLTYISNALKSILNIDNLEIKDIPLDITLQDLSRYIIYGKGTINLNRNPIVLADNGQPSKLHKTLTKLIGVIPGINNNEDVMEIYNKTKTPEFKEWFKDSVLIDDNNEPLLFFHSGASNINSFDKPSKRFNYTFFHQLILPINNSNSAGQIYPVFLKSVNPYELNDFGAFITTVSVKLPFKNNDSYYDQVIKENNHDSVIDYPSYQKEFSEDLYNDNIPLVITEDYRSNDDESPFDAWQRLMEAGEIAIPKSKSYNIKSIFNSGTWNSEDEDIYADKVENSLQSNTLKPYLKNSEFKKRYSGNVIDILNNIMKSGHILSPLIQELLKAPDARKILNSLSTIVITPGSSIYNKYAKDANDIREQKGLSPINLNGLYIHDSKTIAMVNNIIDPNFSDTTFIHEVIHALTKEKIDTEYYKEWTAIYDYVWGKLKDNGINPKDYYAMSNPHELMTGIFTKSDFMKLLASIPGENNTSLFQDIINFFKRILKINNISLLEEVMNEAMNLINNKPVSRKYIDYINSEIGQAVVNNDPIMNYIHGDKADYIDLIESQDNIPEEQPFVRYKYSPLEVKSYINENELINKRVYKQSELNSLLKKVNTINSKQGYTRYKIIKRNDDNYVIIDNIDNEKVETIKKDLLKDKYKKDDYGLNVPWYYYADEIKDRNVIFKHKDIYFSLGKDAFLYMIQNNIDPEYTNQVKNKFSKDLDISNTEYNTLSDIVYKNNNIYLKIINNEPAYIPDYKGILIKKDVPLLFYKGKNLNINKVGTPVLINTKDITIDNNGVVTSDNLPIIELDYDKTITNERKLSNPDYYINTIYNDLKLSAYLTIEEADNISNNIQLKLKRDNQLYDINFRKNGDYVKINMQMNEDNKINVLKNFNPELVGKLVDMNIDVYNMDQNYLQALYNLTTNDLNNDLTCSI